MRGTAEMTSGFGPTRGAKSSTVSSGGWSTLLSFWCFRPEFSVAFRYHGACRPQRRVRHGRCSGGGHSGKGSRRSELTADMYCGICGLTMLPSSSISGANVPAFRISSIYKCAPRVRTTTKNAINSMHNTSRFFRISSRETF